MGVMEKGIVGELLAGYTIKGELRIKLWAKYNDSKMGG